MQFVERKKKSLPCVSIGRKSLRKARYIIMRLKNFDAASMRGEFHSVEENAPI